MNGYLLRLLKTGRGLINEEEEHAFTGLLPCPAEMVCPGANLEEAAQAFIARVNDAVRADGELVLLLDVEAQVESGDLIHTGGGPTPLYVRRLGSTWELV